MDPRNLAAISVSSSCTFFCDLESSRNQRNIHPGVASFAHHLDTLSPFTTYLFLQSQYSYMYLLLMLLASRLPQYIALQNHLNLEGYNYRLHPSILTSASHSPSSVLSQILTEGPHTQDFSDFSVLLFYFYEYEDIHINLVSLFMF